MKTVYLCLHPDLYRSHIEVEVTKQVALDFKGTVVNLRFHKGTQEMETFEAIEKSHAFIIRRTEDEEANSSVLWCVKVALACKVPIWVLKGDGSLIKPQKIQPQPVAA